MESLQSKVSAIAGIAATTTTLSLHFTSMTSATTASLITLISTGLSGNLTSLESQKAIDKYLGILQKHLITLKKFMEDAVLFVFTSIWLFFAGLPYGGFLFWRWANLLYLRLRWGRLTDLVNGYDIIGTIDEPASKQVIMSLKVLKRPFDLPELRARCLKTVSRKNERGQLVFPKFFQRLDTVGGYYCWKPALFDINHHVRFIDGLEPEKVVTEAEVMEILSKLANKQFAEGRPHWEILLIPKFLYNKEVKLQNGSPLESDNFGMVIRIHHGIGDGFSLMKLIMRDMAGEDPEKYRPPAKDPGKPWPWSYRILAFFYILWNSPRQFYKEMSKKDSNPLHSAVTKVCGEKYIVWSEQISVKWLKELKTEMKVGMNTMLFGAVSGALRSYILEQEHGSSNLPLEITALIPAPAPNHPNDTMTNKFAIVLFPLDSKTNDPRLRCLAIEKTGKEIAISPEPHVNIFFTQLIGVAPIIFSKFFIYNTQSTVVISNLPGPDRHIKIWDKELVETMFWLPNVGHSGISVSILSYTDTVRIGLTVDTGIIPQGKLGARHLGNLIIRDLEKMARIVGVNPKGHGIPEDMLLEPGVRRHNSDDELEELLLPDASPNLSTRRRTRNKDYNDTDSTSSSSEDYGFGEAESLEDEEDDDYNMDSHDEVGGDDSDNILNEKDSCFEGVKSRKAAYCNNQQQLENRGVSACT